MQHQPLTFHSKTQGYPPVQVLLDYTDDMYSIICSRNYQRFVRRLSDHNFAGRNADFDGVEVSMADLPVVPDGARPTVVPVLDQHGPSIRKEFSG